MIADEVRTGADFWLGEVEKMVRTLVVMPYKLDSALSRIERGEVAVRSPELKDQMSRLEYAIRQGQRRRCICCTAAGRHTTLPGRAGYPGDHFAGQLRSQFFVDRLARTAALEISTASGNWIFLFNCIIEPRAGIIHSTNLMNTSSSVARLEKYSLRTSHL